MGVANLLASLHTSSWVALVPGSNLGSAPFEDFSLSNNNKYKQRETPYKSAILADNAMNDTTVDA